MGTEDLTIEHSFDSQVTWVIDVLGLYFDMLSMGVRTTRHWRRPVDWSRNEMSVLYLHSLHIVTSLIPASYEAFIQPIKAVGSDTSFHLFPSNGWGKAYLN